MALKTKAAIKLATHIFSLLVLALHLDSLFNLFRILSSYIKKEIEIGFSLKKRITTSNTCQFVIIYFFAI